MWGRLEASPTQPLVATPYISVRVIPEALFSAVTFALPLKPPLLGQMPLLVLMSVTLSEFGSTVVMLPPASRVTVLLIVSVALPISPSHTPGTDKLKRILLMASVTGRYAR